MTRALQAFADWAPIIIGITTAICILILAPLAIFRATRGFAGVGLVTASWVLGAILWIYGAVATFTYWGVIGLMIGLFIFGVGVVPMGFLALALHSQWAWFWNLAILFASIVISRIGGAFFIEATEKRTGESDGFDYKYEPPDDGA